MVFLTTAFIKMICIPILTSKGTIIHFISYSVYSSHFTPLVTVCFCHHNVHTAASDVTVTSTQNCDYTGCFVQFVTSVGKSLSLDFVRLFFSFLFSFYIYITYFHASIFFLIDIVHTFNGIKYSKYFFTV